MGYDRGNLCVLLQCAACAIGLQHFVLNDQDLLPLGHVRDAFLDCRRYNLDAQSPDARAHFLCDAWSGFFSAGHGEQLRRDAFYELHNIVAPTKPPGGWSSHGQPCDQVHSMFRNRIRSLDMSSLGFCGDLRNRPRA